MIDELCKGYGDNILGNCYRGIDNVKYAMGA